MRRLRPILGRLGLVLAAALLTLLVLELALRWLGPPFHSRSLDDKRLFTRFDPELGWANRPGVSGGYLGAGYIHGVRHSAAGLRDEEHEVGKPAGVRRVLVLGDSMVWGLGVENDEIFPRRLEHRLAGTEVIAMGTSGYGTDQELLWFSRDGARYRPDVVVLALYLANDLRDNISSRRYSRNKPRFVLDADGALRLTGTPVPADRSWWRDRVINGIMDPIRRHSALHRLVEGRRHRLHERLRHRAWYRSWFGDPVGGDWTDMYREGEPPQWLARALELTGRLVAELDRRVEAGGGDLEVLLLPHAVAGEPGAWDNWLDAVGLDPTRHDPDATRRRLGQSLQQQGIPVLDPAGVMRGSDEPLYLPEDEHLNPLGHAMIADLLAKRLTTSNKTR